MNTSMKILAQIVAFAALCCSHWVQAQEVDEPKGHIVGVEETWELTVGVPNLLRNAPQVTMAMLPAGSTDSDYFMYTLNYKAAPSYEAGGMQISVWKGERLVSNKNGPQQGQIDVDHDTIQWKQRMSVNDGGVTFEIVGGHSNTWGAFGGQGYLRSTADFSFSNLNNYSPYDSMDESGISFAGNRVAALKLTEIKWHFSNGKSYTADAPFDIDNDELDPWKN